MKVVVTYDAAELILGGSVSGTSEAVSVIRVACGGSSAVSIPQPCLYLIGPSQFVVALAVSELSKLSSESILVITKLDIGNISALTILTVRKYYYRDIYIALRG